MMSCRSLFEQKFFRLHVTTSLHAIEVHATGQIGGVELDFVIAGVDVGVDELGDLLAEGIIDCERNVRSMR